MKCVPDLTIDDFKDKLEMEGSRLDVLAVVAEKAEEKFKEYAAAAEAQATPNARARRRSKRGHGEVSTSTASKRRKSNSAPPLPLPEKFARVIQEIARGKVLKTPATLVIEKTLFSTDVNPSHNRLSIPVSQVVRDDFLTKDEKSLLESYIDPDAEIKKKKYIKVKIIDPSLKVKTVKFSQWDMSKKNGGKTTRNYVINGKWSHIVSENDLTKETRVQLWCFRVDKELGFALVSLKPPATI